MARSDSSSVPRAWACITRKRISSGLCPSSSVAGLTPNRRSNALAVPFNIEMNGDKNFEKDHQRGSYRLGGLLRACQGDGLGSELAQNNVKERKEEKRQWHRRDVGRG